MKTQRTLAVALVFLATVAVLVPPAISLPPHVDEQMNAFAASYYGRKIAKGDFSPVSGSLSLKDPGWNPLAYWSLTQPMGQRYLQALAMGITGAPSPSTGIPTDDEGHDQPIELPDKTRLTLRFFDIFLSATGLALIVWRTRWAGFIAAAIFLAIPHVRSDLARMPCEGPLLFGFGLAAAAWGTRAFAPACGIAALFKLNALPLWLLAFHHGFGGSRFKHIVGFVVAWMTWVALMPPSWFMGGPFYLLVMLQMRIFEFQVQTGSADPAIDGGIFGYYLPTRYLWPVELALLLVATHQACSLWTRFRTSHRSEMGVGCERP